MGLESVGIVKVITLHTEHEPTKIVVEELFIKLIETVMVVEQK